MKIRNKLLFFDSLLMCVVAIANAQSATQFAAGEAQRVFDLLDGLGCFGNIDCTLKDFTPTAECDFDTNYLKCNGTGHMEYLCVQRSL
jgi:hypothetical protein